jgi:hypothetical protein
MRKIDTISIQQGTHERSISFWQGNPADTPADDPVDLIIVSAFRDNYEPTKWSIIGALDRKGLSVETLSRDKAIDLRGTAGFWLSQSLAQGISAVGVRRVLCFEPHFLGEHASELVGQLFRGLFPFLSDAHEATVAMAIIATGAIGEDPERMLRALVSAAFMWMSRGLPIRELRIMEQLPDRSTALTPVFADLKKELSSPASADESNARFHVFLSFAHDDVAVADNVAQALRVQSPEIRLFDYRLSIDVGKAWQDEIDQAIGACLKMVALLSPSYFRSDVCREELGVGRLLHRRRSESFLFPIYARSLQNSEELPFWLQAINYIDCREVDTGKLTAAAKRLAQSKPDG